MSLSVSLTRLPSECDAVEEIGAGELGVIVRLFERAIQEIDIGVRENLAQMRSVVLEGELEGVALSADFSLSCPS